MNIDNYQITFKMSVGEHDFLDIRDVRNGEVYCFIKKLNEENYTFYRNYQEHSTYSIKDHKYDDDCYRTEVYHDRPINPFKKLTEYRIELKPEHFDIKLASIMED